MGQVEGPPKEEGPFRKTDLVEIVRLDDSISLDIRYATTNNFVEKKVYDEPRAFLQRPAAEALLRVNQFLKTKGLGLIIFDAYRPWHVTKIFWDFMPMDKKQFVADPSKGSVHSRGCAVDLTLKNLKAGKPLVMPSEFDEWTDRSRIDYPNASKNEIQNRDLLRSAMEKEGFLCCDLEWWHYTYKDWEEYAVENLKFSEIKSR